ncbi:hypothetical protein ARMGADRAFT_579609 [Armillaria gallica]|uniref:Uncharacterized protein n=1 Tax=Armillaria gallica TaxID=47427 RepID=A0A2H3DTF5_ARMGA|nr:hypothetical protein ARMGADRAFT_579609 [Armillaria gallica]
MLTAQTTLLQNPLALALESLRSIAVRFVAVINLAEAAPCLMHALRQFFPLSTLEHILPPTGATHSIGVHVALGNTDATNIDIYASFVGNNVLQLLAARKHLHQFHYRGLMMQATAAFVYSA